MRIDVLGIIENGDPCLYRKARTTAMGGLLLTARLGKNRPTTGSACAMNLQNLCILRLSAIGDVIHVLPVIAAVRAQRPGLAITWVIGKLEHRLVEGLEGVEFVVFDKSAGLSAYRDIRRALAGRRFDALLHMQVALRANLASLAVRAATRIGFDPVRARDLHGLFVHRRIRGSAEPHVAEGLMSFLEPLDLKPAPPQWHLPLAPADWDFASRHIDPQRRSLAICPVSSHRLRNWRPDRYAAVADYAAERHGFQVLLCGGPGTYERGFADAVLAATRHPPLDLVGRDTLKQLAAVLGSADLVLAPDTGPAHIANAMGTPVIGLYAATNPRRSGPYGSIQWCVDRYDEAARKCRGVPAKMLRWGTRLEYPGVMDLIQVEEVTGRVDAWIAGQPSPGPGQDQP